MKQLQEILTKLLVKLPKNTLAALIVALGTILIGHWYKDYKIDKDTVKTDISAIKKDFQDYKRVSRNEHKTIRMEISNLDKRETSSEQRIGIITLKQDKQTREILRVLNHNINHTAVEKHIEDTAIVEPIIENLQPIKNNHTILISNELMAMISIQPDTVPKKRSLLGRILNIFK